MVIKKVVHGGKKRMADSFPLENNQYVSLLSFGENIRAVLFLEFCIISDNV